MSYSKATGIETWTTSDGRAYLVQLNTGEGHPARASLSNASQASEQVSVMFVHEETVMTRFQAVEGRRSQDSNRSRFEARWQGTCIHNVEPPRWVQKRRRKDPDELKDGEYPYDEPRRAMTVAINTRFSLIAIGTHGYVPPLRNLAVA